MKNTNYRLKFVSSLSYVFKNYNTIRKLIFKSEKVFILARLAEFETSLRKETIFQ